MRKLGKVIAATMAAIVLVSSLQLDVSKKDAKAASSGITSASFLKANGTVLKDNYGSGQTVYLRGVNAGSVSVQEPWMTNTANSANVNAQIDIINVLTNRFGAATAKAMLETYRDNYWVTTDFDKCAELGFNSIRLPLWYRDFMDESGNWRSDAFDYVDWFVNEASSRGIYVIIDMHGAPGSQNGSDHSGKDGGNNKEAASEFFFGNNAASNQEKYYQMWEKIADHYKGNPAVAGYDLLNEPYCTYRYSSSHSENELHTILWDIYDVAYDRIRAKDPDHLIIMEATWDEWDLPNPTNYGWTNVMYEYHQYEYSNFYNEDNKQITSLQNKINNMRCMGYNVPRYMGEFNLFNNMDAWSTGLSMLNEAGFSWSIWSYKCKTDNDNWGLYKNTANQANLDEDSYDTIMNKWSAANLGSNVANTALINVVKNFTPGTASTVDYARLSSGTYYIANDSNIVTAPNSGADALVANAGAHYGAGEEFEVVNNNDGSISLKSVANGKYICCVIDEESQLLARSNAIQDWEKFYLVATADGKYGLLSNANGKFVKADYNNSVSGKLIASSDSIAGAWEAFNFNPINVQEEPSSEEPTSSGPNKPGSFDAFSRIEGEAFKEMSGGVIDTNTSASGGYNLGGIINNVTAKYENVNFSEAASSINICYSSPTGTANGNVEVYVDNTNNKVGTVTLTNNGSNWQTYGMTTVRLDNEISAGSHTIYLKFVQTNSAYYYVCNLDYFNFIKSSNDTTLKPGHTLAPDGTWTYAGNWGCYFGSWAGTAQGSYKLDGNTYSLYFLQANPGVAWLAQASYTADATAEHTYYVEASVTLSKEASIGIKEDISNEADAPAYTTIGAGQTKTLTGTYQVNASANQIKVMFELGNVPKGTDVIFNSIRITDITPKKTLQTGIELNGYQVNAKTEGMRTVYTVDSTINGYDVVESGVIYGMGTIGESAGANGNAMHYAYDDEMVVGSVNPYVRSYASTNTGKFSSVLSDTEIGTTYAMTMRFAVKNVVEYTATCKVRAYARLSNGSYVYTDIYTYRIYDVADYLYQNRKMPNATYHNYLYTDILTVADENYGYIAY